MTTISSSFLRLLAKEAANSPALREQSREAERIIDRAEAQLSRPPSSTREESVEKAEEGGGSVSTSPVCLSWQSACSFDCPACGVRHDTPEQLASHLIGSHGSPSPSPSSPSTAMVPAFACPHCAHVFVDSIDSLLCHMDCSHSGRSRFIAGCDDETIDQLFVLVERRRVAVCRTAYTEDGAETAARQMLAHIGKWMDSVEHLVPAHPPVCPVYMCGVRVESKEEFKSHLSSHTGWSYQRWRSEAADKCKEELDWKSYVRVRQRNVLKRRDIRPDAVLPATLSSLQPTAVSSVIQAGVRATAGRDSVSSSSTSPVSGAGGMGGGAGTGVAGTTGTPPVVKMPVAVLPPSLSSLPSREQLAREDAARRMKRAELMMRSRTQRPPKPVTAKKLLETSCMQCGIVFENRCQFTKHMMDHKAQVNPFRCPIRGCLLSYAEKQKLRSHLYRKHPQLSADSIESYLGEGEAVPSGQMATATISMTGECPLPLFNDGEENITKAQVLNAVKTEVVEEEEEQMEKDKTREEKEREEEEERDVKEEEPAEFDPSDPPFDPKESLDVKDECVRRSKRRRIIH